VLEDDEHEEHVEGTFGPTRVPQVLPPLLLPLLLLAVPPLLPPLLPVPASDGAVPQTPPRGTQPLTCAPSTLLSVTHDSSAEHVVPVGQRLAQ